MSSPRTGKSGPAKPAKSIPGVKVPRGADKLASDAGMSGKDKANFIKAMMEGVTPKTAASAKATREARRPPEAPKKVEILRKIPAARSVATPSNPESDEAIRFAAMLEAKLAAGELGVLTPEATQALMSVLCKQPFYRCCKQTILATYATKWRPLARSSHRCERLCQR